MSSGGEDSVDSYFLKSIDAAIKEAIEDQVKRKMPEIVAAACASVTGRVEKFLNFERFGSDLRITILNAYKPEDLK